MDNQITDVPQPALTPKPTPEPTPEPTPTFSGVKERRAKVSQPQKLVDSEQFRSGLEERIKTTFDVTNLDNTINANVTARTIYGFVLKELSIE